MKRLLLSLFGAVSRDEHILQIIKLKNIIKYKEEQIAQLQEQLKELQAEHPEKEDIMVKLNAITHPSKIEKIFINILNDFKNNPYAPILTENNKYIGMVKDGQLYISNSHLVKRYNEMYNTSFKILPPEFANNALKQGFIKPSRWKRSPAIHRIILSSGKRESHVALNVNVNTLRKNA